MADERGELELGLIDLAEDHEMLDSWREKIWDAAELLGECRRAMRLVRRMSYGYSETCECVDCKAHRAARDVLVKLEGGQSGG